MSEQTAETARASTGDPRVDAIVARLDELGDRPLSDRAAALLQLENELAGVLDSTDDLVSDPSSR